MLLNQFNNREFDRGTSRLKEVFWWAVRSLFFAGSFPLPSALKVFWLRLFGAQVGEGVVIRSKVDISFPWKLSLGDHVWIGNEVNILSLDKVTIGSNVCISQRAFLCTGSHDMHSEGFELVTKPIVIEDGTWICATSFIAPGVTMSAGSVCASGSVVVTNVEKNTVVGGNPSKFIKQRYES